MAVKTSHERFDRPHCNNSETFNETRRKRMKITKWKVDSSRAWHGNWTCSEGQGNGKQSVTVNIRFTRDGGTGELSSVLIGRPID